MRSPISVIFILAIVISAVGSVSAHTPTNDSADEQARRIAAFRGKSIASPPLDSTVGPIALNNYRGKLLLLSFGYTACPDICPLSLSTIGRALGSLTKDESRHVRAVFISLDPQRDSIEILRQFTGYFHPDIIGATGTPTVLTRLSSDFQLDFRRIATQKSPLGYLITHRTEIMLVNSAGEVTQLFEHNSDPNKIVESISEMLLVDR